LTQSIVASRSRQFDGREDVSAVDGGSERRSEIVVLCAQSHERGGLFLAAHQRIQLANEREEEFKVPSSHGVRVLGHLRQHGRVFPDGFQHPEAVVGVVSIDRKLTADTVNGVLPCFDASPPFEEVCVLSVVEAFEGRGELANEPLHYQFDLDGFFINGVLNGKSREAQVVSARITGCRINLTEEDAQFAQLESLVAGEVDIQRS
jgi:hypothetical protein